MKPDDEEVLRRYLTGDQKLKTIPRKQSRKLVILKWLAERFEFGRNYPEREVNELLSQVHEDFATLRRELYDHYLMDRADGIYRRRLVTDEEQTF